MSDIDHEPVPNWKLTENCIETPMKHSTYDPADLATLACTYINKLRGGEPSPRQEAALNRFQAANLGDFKTSWATDFEVLKTYLEVFDEMFFFGSLSQVTLSLHDYDSHNGGGSTAFDEEFDEKGGSTWTCHIKVSVTNFTRKDQEWRMCTLLGDLLKEMITAYLTIYSCECCWDSSKGLGEGGHGDAWQRIASVVEEVVREKVNSRVDLCRARHLAAELIIGGRDMSASEFEELGLNERRMRWWMRHLERQIDEGGPFREVMANAGWSEKLNRPIKLESEEYADKPENLKSIIQSLIKTYKRWLIVWPVNKLRIEDYRDDLETLKSLIEAVIFMKKRYVFVWPTGGTLTSSSTDSEDLKALVERNMKRDDDWTFIWSPDVPQMRNEDFVDDLEKFESLVEFVKQMREDWEFDYVKMTCELRSEDFVDVSWIAL